MFKKSLLSLSVLTALTGISACQTAGDSDQNGDQSFNARETVRGRITAFGSIFVNGVEYETDGATITIDGKPASEDDLELGMIVTVAGSSDGSNGQALSVSYDDDVEGIITQVNVDANGIGTVTVMEHTITIDANTVVEIRAMGIQSLTDAVYNPDQGVQYVAEVSGHADGNGNILATRIEVKSFNQNAGEFDVKGRINSLDTATMTFSVGGMAVVYNDTTRLDDLSAGDLQNDLLVEVKGHVLDQQGRLVADVIERESASALTLDAEEDIHMEGVAHGVDSDSFDLDDQTFHIAANTAGTDKLRDGTVIKVEAHVNDDGDMIADSIAVDEHDDSGNIRTELTGAIEDIDTDKATVTVMGRTISITNDTIKHDDYSDIRYFSLADIDLSQTAQCAEVTVQLDSNGVFTATRFEYQGPCGSSLAEIDGVLVNTDGVYSIAGVSMDLSGVAPASNGSRTEAKGNYIDGIFYAVSLEAEDSEQDSAGETEDNTDDNI